MLTTEIMKQVLGQFQVRFDYVSFPCSIHMSKQEKKKGIKAPRLRQTCTDFVWKTQTGQHRNRKDDFIASVAWSINHANPQ